MNEPKLYDTPTAAGLIGLPVETVRNLTHRGVLRAEHPGRVGRDGAASYTKIQVFSLYVGVAYRRAGCGSERFHGTVKFLSSGLTEEALLEALDDTPPRCYVAPAALVRAAVGENNTTHPDFWIPGALVSLPKDVGLPREARDVVAGLSLKVLWHQFEDRLRTYRPKRNRRLGARRKVG